MFVRRRESVFMVVLTLALLLSASLTGAGPVATTQAQSSPPPLIHLQQATFDPLQGQPGLPADLRLDAYAKGVTGVYIVQFRGPVEEAWKQAVVAAGGKLYGYLPDYAFQVRLDETARQKVAGLPFVRWVGVYQPAYKLAPPLGQAAGTAATTRVTLLTFEPDTLAEVSRAIEIGGGQALQQAETPDGGLLRADVPPAGLAALAQHPAVRWIEPYVQPELTNDAGRGATEMNVDAVQQVYGLTGVGQIVGHADTGLDTGNLATLHPDLRDRIQAAYAWGRRALTSYASPAPGPMGLAWDGANLWHLDWQTHLLYKLGPTGGILSSCLPSPSNTPGGLAWDGVALWFVERSNNTVYQIDRNCAVLSSFVGPGSYAYGITWDGTALWLTDTSTHKVYQVTPTGTVIKSFDAPPSTLGSPTALAWINGSLWLADYTYDMLFKLDASGAVLESLPAPSDLLTGMAWDGVYLWTSDPSDDQLYKTSLAATSQGNWSDPNGHGTHTAGSILGTGAAFQGTGTPGLGQYRGTAPGAKLVHQSVMSFNGALSGLPLDLNQLFQQAYDAGARIHSDSWGASVAGQYTTDAMAADRFMWDHKDTLLVFSAGNSGVDANNDGVVDMGAVGSPGTAKNLLTIGAAETYRPGIADTWARFGFTTNPLRDDKEANNVNGMAAFSSRGPTRDGRIKPDLVAPGTFIASTRTQSPLRDNFEATTVAAGPSGAPGLSPACQVTEKDAQATITCPGEAVAPKAETETATTALTWTPAGNWLLQTSSWYSASHAWANANYAANNTTGDMLKSSVIDARGGVAVLSFWARGPVGSDDSAVVFFSDDNFVYGTGPRLTLTQSTWQRFSVAIPWGRCSGSNCLNDRTHLQIGFYLSSGSTAGSGEGFYVDDVRLTGGDWGLLSDYGLAPLGSPADESYILEGGTSMATPLTAGAVALARQYYTDRLHVQPSAALLKATLIDGATDMTPGQYGPAPAGWPTFLDTMEAGAGNWTAQSPWAITTEQAYSGVSSWSDSPSGLYANSVNVALTLNRSFDLATMTNPRLSLWRRFDLESGFDYGYVEISTDGGSTWTMVRSYNGTSLSWQPDSIPLNAYATAHDARFRFRLQTDSSVQKDGWYIDDVVVGSANVQEIARRPDPVQGWGRVNLARSLYPTAPRQRTHVDNLSLSTGQTYQKTVTSTTSAEPLRVTVAWTDYPAAVEAAVSLVNNLDLKVIGPTGATYYPNGGTGPDTRNTVETVEIVNPPSGVYTIEVYGQSVPQAPQPFALVVSGALPSVTAPPPPSDLNGDRRTDLVWRNSAAGLNVAWFLDAPGLSSGGVLPSVTDPTWKIAAIGDLNGDGKADLVWRNTATGDNLAWFMDGATMTGYGWLPTVPGVTWKVLACADLNADGKADLIWRDTLSGMDIAWLLNGTTLVGYGALPTLTDAAWRLVGVGDLNGDQKPDLVWRNSGSGQNVVWYLDGAAATGFAMLPTVTDLGWQLVGTGDVNADGKADLVWRHGTAGQNIVWLMDGASIIGAGPLPSINDPNWKVVAVGDVNGDGKTDLVWRQLTGGTMVAWFLDGTSLAGYAVLPTMQDSNWQVISPASLLSAVYDATVAAGKLEAPAASAEKRTPRWTPFWTAAPAIAPMLGTPASGGMPMAMGPAQWAGPMWTAAEPLSGSLPWTIPDQAMKVPWTPLPTEASPTAGQ